MRNEGCMKVVRKVLLLISLLVMFLSCMPVQARNYHSIIGDWVSPVFSIKLADGSGLMEGESDKSRRKEINDEIYSGEATKTYSLYDRFGPGISFVPYFGETRIKTTLLDSFYNAILERDDEFKITAEQILDILKDPGAISNNSVYENRPEVLDGEWVESGSKDTRVSAYSALSTSGANASVGNAMLAVSKTLTSITSWMSGAGLFDSLSDVWDWLCNNGLSDLLQTIGKFFMPVAVLFFVIFLIRHAYGTISGRSSVKSLLSRLGGTVVSLGLAFSLMASPNAFSTVLTTIVTFVDDALDETFAQNGTEVSKSDVKDHAREAAMWETSVFEPWCIGTFDTDYDHLWTQWSDKPDSKKMFQSNDDIDTAWDDGSKKYNSVKYTGDVTIPLGKDESVKNWAALAWSCQSIYHINAVQTDDGETLDEQIPVGIWPRAQTAPMNDDIYVDNFRYIDAMLNISPEYTSMDEIELDYRKSRPYSEHFVYGGWLSIYRTLLLIPIMILSWKKAKQSILILTSGVRLCYCSMVNMMMPERYSVLGNLKNAFMSLFHYMWYSVLIFIAITVYKLMMGNSMLVDFGWILLGTYLIQFRPERAGQTINDLKRWASIRAGNMADSLDRQLGKLRRK